MNVLLILSHSIEEYDQLRLLSGLGYNVFSLGGYIDPAHPHDPKRPALPDVPHLADLHAAVDALGTQDNIGTAATHLPEEILDWADVIVCHHYLERIFGQWDHLAEWRAGGGRVIWRTVGQSTEANERRARAFRDDGLEIVRYSPNESAIPGYIGGDVIIRFYKDPGEWYGWTGEGDYITNVTQDFRRRGTWCNYEFFQQATAGHPVVLAGPGSEEDGGLGTVSVDRMLLNLQSARGYLYTGTQPASYTLGLIEAMMVGVPVVSIGPGHMTVFPYGDKLYEGHTIAGLYSDDPEWCQAALAKLLDREDGFAEQVSAHQRHLAIQTFGIDAVGKAWREYLGTP